ncbi:hypothetical protein MJO28_002137 [Puccinia striiformis f. sp. tritici]|uniref:Uncharacterized protein n=1 Tax=Puccinia striiformis f. sp. tritici TaxID=168172 RepID=A0ACC0EVI0_9BASI|nr:hypothetical protein Pst134EB_033275 [Puccinia striiformis f. sp. tritici]KAI7961648.1 hypothetical protein MJO28_002137 [Puccinia striiformis f. sp. tritici]
MVRTIPNRKPHLSTETKAMIVGMSRAGKSLSFLSKEFETPRSTLSGIISRWKETGTCESKDRPGRPPMTTERDERELKHLRENQRQAPMKEIVQSLTNPISVRTGRRRAHKLGYHNRSVVKKSSFDKTQKA